MAGCGALHGSAKGVAGWPVSAWQTISVAGPLAIVAGSCSTIAMLLEHDAEPFLAGQGVRWLGVDAAGRMRGSAA